MGRRRGRRRFRRTQLLDALAGAQACAKPCDPTPAREAPAREAPVIEGSFSEEKIVTAKRNLHRLEQKEYYRLYKWLEEHVPNLALGITYAQIAEMVRKDCAFDCTEWHVKGGLETCGLSLPRAQAPLDPSGQIKILASLIAYLWGRTFPGDDIPDQLKRLL